jgi:hypothetical protein
MRGKELEPYPVYTTQPIPHPAHPEDGDSILLRKVRIRLQDYKVSKHGRLYNLNNCFRENLTISYSRSAGQPSG